MDEAVDAGMKDRAIARAGEPSVTAYTALSELPTDVRAFLQERTRDRFFLGEGWFDLILRFSPPAGYSPRIYVLRMGAGGPVSCALFAAESLRSYGRRPQLVSLTNFYSLDFAPIVHSDPACAADALDGLAAAILHERPRWDVIEFRGLLMEAPTTGALVRAFRNHGMLVDTYFQFENWYQPMSGMSADAYFSCRSSRLRNTVTRKLKRLQREHRLEFFLYQGSAEVSKGAEEYRVVYAHSWKLPETYPEFIPNLLRKAAAEGALRLGVLKVDGQPVAAQIWLLAGGRATIYKLAYDERYAPFSVGSILTKFMFDRIIDEDHVLEVDFGSGSEPYKLEWMSACRNVVGLIGFRAYSPAGLLAATRHYLGRFLRRRPRPRIFKSVARTEAAG